MKSFKQLVVEQKNDYNPVVTAFGRMNPPTTGHLKLIDKVKEIADKQKAPHVIAVSHSQDSKKNPLTPQQKINHLNRYSPGTHFVGASSNSPTILHHASNLYAAGHKHLIMVAGSDRVKEYHDLLNRYNGVEGKHGHFKFDKIEVKSAGHRDPDAEGAEGMSGSKMRQHAKNNDFSSFRQGVPSHVSDEHAKELMHDVRKGLHLNENYSRGFNKAIFVVGGPGSGKDIILRECINEEEITELNFSQVIEILNDKHKLAMSYMQSRNLKMEAVKYHKPLIVNGPAEDLEKIHHIKEELEELGYKTMMVFVSTTEQISKERNKSLSKMMMESIRFEKWNKAQTNFNVFTEMFDNFVEFDNSLNKNMLLEDLENVLSTTTKFLDSIILDNNVNKFLKIYESKLGSKSIQRTNLKDKGLNVLKDNNSPVMQFAAKLGRRDDVRDGDIKMNTGYTPRIGGGSTYAEDKNPVMVKSPEPKVSNFNRDADSNRKRKVGDKSLTAARIGSVDGVGSSYDTRGGSTGAANAGLGDNTYHEEREFSNDDVANFAGQTRGVSPNPLAEKNKKLKKFKESIFDFGQGDSGVGGTLGGAGNKEDFVKPSEKFGQSGITIKKKKTGVK